VRRPSTAWLRSALLVALVASVAGCSLSLRGAGPVGGPFATPTPFRAPGPPSVTIASPADESFGSVGHTTAFDVRGSDAWPVGVARLELFAGDNLVDRALTAGGANKINFGSVLEWTPTAPGRYELSAFAYRADGMASPPATVDMIITGTAITPSPSPSPVPLSTPSPSPSSSAGASLSPSPSFGPTLPPTPKPTPKPTPEPIAVRVDVWVEEADLPDWTAGQTEALIVHVQNIGGETVPFVRVVATLAGSSGKTRTGTLIAGQHTTVAIILKPQQAGEHLLTVTGKLPVGYYDPNPAQNTLVWEHFVTVNPAPTPPPPTESPPPNL
jgi:hypothetical protein